MSGLEVGNMNKNQSVKLIEKQFVDEIIRQEGLMQRP